MKETCYNCEHYWSEVHNPDNEEEHSHDFCRLHGCFLNVWLKNGWLLENAEKMTFVYDDLECGDAVCYMFEGKERYKDEFFDKNKAHNDEIEAKIVEKAKKEGWYWE